MDNINYPLQATTTGDLQIIQDSQSVAVSRVRLLIDTKIGERLFIPNYGTYISPFNTSNAEFEDSMINAQVENFCLENLNVECQIRVSYEYTTEELKYTLEFNNTEINQSDGNSR